MIDQITSRKPCCSHVHVGAEEAIARNCGLAIAKIFDAIAKNYESIAKNHENRQSVSDRETVAVAKHRAQGIYTKQAVVYNESA
jgi:hypothetical protein